jgi:hypothetical protein
MDSPTGHLHTVPHERELFEVAVATRDGCTRIVGSQAESVVSLLAVASFHLQSAHVGARLASMANDENASQLLREVATDYGGVSSASLNLAVRCSVTAVDLCAAALARLDGISRGQSGREFDAGGISHHYRSNAPGESLSCVALPFLARLESKIWTDTTHLRHELTHRRYVRGLHGSTRKPPEPTPLAFPAQIDVPWGTAGMVPLDGLTAQIVDFAESTYRQFCNNLESIA